MNIELTLISAAAELDLAGNSALALELIEARDAMEKSLASIVSEFGNSKPNMARIGQIAESALASFRG